MLDVAHKVTTPQRPRHLVGRQRLRDIIDSVESRQLVLLIAPAGYGKTSLLLDWVHTTRLPTCWYSLDRYDADPHTFLTCLGASLLQRYPGRLPLTSALIQSGATWPVELGVATIGREIADLGETVLLVLDDWHLVDHVADISRALADLLRRAANCRAILASRTYPSIPDVMLLTAHGQVTGLAESQLRFTAEEATAVLAAQLPGALAPAEVVTLVERANGWITAVLLMARAPELAAQAFGHASEHQVFAFLAEQVFDRLDADIRSFLFDSALLEDLEAGRCDELLERSDSELMLDLLLRQHLFVSPIDGEVLRYHPLFREFLVKRYRREDRQRLRRSALRIAEAYATRGLWAQAFDLCMLAEDIAEAQRMLGRGGDALFHQGQITTLERCFGQLALAGLPSLLLCLKGRLYLSKGATEEAAALADLALARMQPADQVSVRLFQADIAQKRGEYRDAIALAEEALQHDPPDDQRATALRFVANCHARLGEREHAVHLLSEALRIQRQRGDLYHLALISHDMGILHEQAGQLREAERCYQQAEGYWTTIGNVGARALSRNSSAVVMHASGRFREAHAQLLAAMQDAQTAQVALYLAAIAASQGDLYADLGLWDLAEASYQRAREAGGSAFIRGYVEVAGLWLLARQRRYGPVLAELGRLEPPVARRHHTSLALLRVAVAWGQQRHEDAGALLREARASIGEQPATPDGVRALVWEAQLVADQGVSRLPLAIEALDTARAWASSLGHDTFLVTELAHHTSLLRRVGEAGWPYAEELLGRVGELQVLALRISGQVGVPIITVRALGCDVIEVDGAAIALGQRKAREVLYYLLAHPRGGTVDEMREALWPDRDETSSRHLLYTAVRFLRNALPPNVISMFERRLYRLERNAIQLQYDVEQFLEMTDPQIRDPAVLVEAIDSYRGTFLQWCESEWSQRVRSLLEQRFVQAIHRASQAFEQRHLHHEALRLYERALALDSLDETAMAGVMRCHLALGNRAAAITSYHRSKRQLIEDLGLEPDPRSELEQIYAQICRAG